MRLRGVLLGKTLMLIEKLQEQCTSSQISIVDVEHKSDDEH